MFTDKIGTYSLIIILITVSFLGCSPKTVELVSTGSVAETEDRDFTPVPKTDELAGTSWELVSLNGKDLIEGTAITLEFSETYLGGQMRCNGYGGSRDTGKYFISGDGTFQLGDPFAVTVQLCTEPEGIMEQEAEYIETLMSASNYQIEADRLEIKNEVGERILIYQNK